MDNSGGNFEPGSAKLGNFINYYSFNPAQNRIKLLPSDLWKTCAPDDPYLCLDVGCNTGELTQALYDFLSVHIKREKLHFLGIDVDNILIERANELNRNLSGVTFSCTDALDIAASKDVTSFLEMHSRECFNVTFLFSVTMWIHLNHGDDGLRRFLKSAASMSEMVVVEPQPWKCYKSAARRMKKLGLDPFPHWHKMEMCQAIENDIMNILVNDCHFQKIFQTQMTTWGRTIYFFKRTEDIIFVS
ncbi:hypothetical protein AAG570_001022 [Ranatra chinensis]|uniref:RNA methyltransferase n=1 Tax=Ranatra chinensis TaxID=642074 RepID=A0ABD0YT83_9HEMI